MKKKIQQKQNKRKKRKKAKKGLIRSLDQFLLSAMLLFLKLVSFWFSRLLDKGDVLGYSQNGLKFPLYSNFNPGDSKIHKIVKVSSALESIALSQDRCLLVDQKSRIWSWGDNQRQDMSKELPPFIQKPTRLDYGLSAVVLKKKNLTRGGSILSVPALSRFKRKPTLQQLEESLKIHLVVFNSLCTFFVTEKGVFAIGDAKSPLRSDFGASAPSGTVISLNFAKNAQIVGLSAGNHHAIAWSREGEAFAWGINHHHVLGIKGNLERKDEYIANPQKVEILGNLKVVEALATPSASFVITERGRVFYWGK